MQLDAILVNSGAKYRKEVLAMPIAALMDTVLSHMTLRMGVRGNETVGAAGSDAELRPYKSEKGATDTTSLIGRTLTTYLGDVVEEFDPYQLFSTVYGEQWSDLTERKEADIVKTLSLAQAKTVSKKLAKAMFCAKRNASGSKTTDLFDGFDTIAAKEVTATNLSTTKGNYIEVDQITELNAGDVLQAIYDAASEELTEAEDLKMFMPKSVKKMYEKWCLANFGAVVLLIGLVLLTIRRKRQNPRFFTSNYQDWYLLGIIWVITLTGCLSQMFRLADAVHCAYIVYYLHLVFVWMLFAYLPWSKLGHLAYRTCALLFVRMYGRG